MSQEFKFKDAKQPLTLHVQEQDMIGARPGDSKNCVLTRAGRREHRCYDITVLRSVAYVRFTERGVPLRYEVSASARDLLISFDASGRTRPITITFIPPRRHLRTSYLRSNHFKQIRTKSRIKRAKELAAGKTGLRKAYTKPDPLTLIGVRNGMGIRPPGSGKMLRSV